MSRKPTAVSLSAPKKRRKPKTETAKSGNEASTTKPYQRQKSSDTGDGKSVLLRKPRAMKPPVAEEAVDVLESDERTEPASTSAIRSFPQKASRWPKLFFAAVFGFVTLGLGLWFTELIEGLFARNEVLGWIASTLLGFAVFCLFIMIIREILGLWRLRKLGRIRGQVLEALEDGGTPSATIIPQIIGLYESRDDMQWHLSRMNAHQDDVIDDRDRMLIAERTLMKPLDDEAKKIIATSAKRISVVTAVNPAASLDVIFTGYQVLSMLRQLSALYGNRPGSIGTVKLAGMVGSHLAVTGGLALSDTFIQQFLGKGLAGRLSAKLGEGAVNGIMTARIGIAALDLCRPMPFMAVERPGLKEFIAMFAGSFGAQKSDESEKV